MRTMICRTREGAWYEFTRTPGKEDITPLSPEQTRKLFSQRRLGYLNVRYFPAAQPASPVMARPELHRSKKYEGLRGNLRLRKRT